MSRRHGVHGSRYVDFLRTIKSPTAEAVGLNSLFFKRGNCELRKLDTGILLLLDPDLIVFVVVVLLASKSCKYPFFVSECSYTSLGQGIESKTCANIVADATNSRI